MKKVVFSIISIILIIVVLFTFICCRKNKKNEEKEVIYKDEKSGYTLKFKIPQDSKYLVKDIDQEGGRFAELTMENKEKNVEIVMYYFEITDENYKKIQQDRVETAGYKEYKWNQYDGYSYLGDKYSVSFNMYLKGETDTSRAVCLFGSMEYINNDNANSLETFNSEEFQKIMNTMEFSE